MKLKNIILCERIQNQKSTYARFIYMKSKTNKTNLTNAMKSLLKSQLAFFFFFYKKLNSWSYDSYKNAKGLE